MDGKISDGKAPSPLGLISRFLAKAASEVAAVVIIMLGNLYFVFNAMTLFPKFAEHEWLFIYIVSFTQALVFGVCFRILWDHSFSFLKHPQMAQSQSEQRPLPKG